MAGLTPQQEAFCQEYVACGNASEAYRRTYNASRMKPETVNRKAKELLDNGKITARLEDLKAELAKRNLWTREQSVQALIEVIQHPDKKTDIIAAVKELNAMHGYNAPDKLEVTGQPLGPVILNINYRNSDGREVG